MNAKTALTADTASLGDVHHTPRFADANTKYAPIALVEPTTRGCIHLAAEVKSRRLAFLPPCLLALRNGAIEL